MKCGKCQPEVNTVLFLRPTESLTIFLQQLGRGLRLSQGKDCLTVLDFIGAANRRYNFEEKYEALLGPGHRSVRDEIRRGFTAAPKGCYILLEEKARREILRNIEQTLRGSDELVKRLKSFQEDTGLPVTLENFLSWYHLDPGDIYRKQVTFSRLCAAAGVMEDFSEPLEERLKKQAFMRLARIDSRKWIRFLLDMLPRLERLNFASLPPLEEQMMQMLYVTLFDECAESWEQDEVRVRLQGLHDSPVMMREILDLLKVQYNRIDFVDGEADLAYPCALSLHCTYTQRQILSALGYRNFSAMRQGVLYLKDRNTDVFFVTLNKSDREYSPSTMYEDYAISRTLFHWQSQSTTAEDSATGQRYIHHAERGGNVLLFVRECKRDDYGTSPYTFLGKARYVSHTGTRPMSIVWQLEAEIPAKYMQTVQQMIG
ncbi:MAG: DUF3427 domain-containing protein [Clostridia bacterium]|nr:DUF3427 domain-containing protein [Clostridia bacterium]